jgi:Fur family ferric uptake transcriptional regulator
VTLVDQFARWLQARQIRPTSARRAIAEHLDGRGGHATLQQLSQELHPTVSKITVYRTVRLLEEAGLVERLELHGVDHYEVRGEHHDHIVCVRCGQVAEFHSDGIEARQRAIALAHGFEATGHRHLLYGRCASCRGLPPPSRPDAELTAS